MAKRKQLTDQDILNEIRTQVESELTQESPEMQSLKTKKRELEAQLKSIDDNMAQVQAKALIPIKTKEIQQLLAMADSLIGEAVKIADQHRIPFHWSGPMGSDSMGGYYRPYSSWSESDSCDNEPFEWFSSSTSC